MIDDPIKKPVKLLVGHINPDLDVIGAMWQLMRYCERDFEQAQMYFVRAGEQVDMDTLRAKETEPDEVVYVDTGLGPFDHHQPGNTAHDSATLRVYQYLINRYPDLEHDQALKRLVIQVNETDHFGSYWWPQPTDDRYMMALEEILSGLRSGRQFNDRELVEFGMVCLDGVMTSMKVKVSAEADLQNKGLVFKTTWGSALAVENSNDEIVKLGLKSGHKLVVRKDSEKGHVRIKSAPLKEINLRKVYEEIIAKDRVGTWYFHPSGHMVLNNSKKNADSVPSKLSLEELVKIIKSVC